MSPRWIGDGYLHRFQILMTPWFSIFFHRIYRADNQRDLHDHPWNFFSIILRGWYGENVPREDSRGQEYVKRRWFNFKVAEDRHSIRTVSRVPVWSLVFTGRRRRTWGFWVRDTVPWGPCGLPMPVERFVPWDQYEKLNDA